jgi:hypothetical protein
MTRRRPITITIRRARAEIAVMFLSTGLKKPPGGWEAFASLLRLSLGLTNRTDPAKNDEDRKNDEGDKAETVTHDVLSVTAFLQPCRIA